MKHLNYFVFLILTVSNLYADSVFQNLQKTQTIMIKENSPKVISTCAKILKDHITHSFIHAGHIKDNDKGKTIFIGIADVNEVKFKNHIHPKRNWIFIQLSRSGMSKVLASTPYLLYTAVCRLVDDWNDYDLSVFEQGHFFYPTFEWVEGNDGFFAARKYFSCDYEPNQSVREFAKIGCTHIPVNALAMPFPYEQGPPGEHYYRFYITNPDLDQFVETELNHGTYPPEHLAANRNQMNKNIKLARSYGLAPGLTMCAPRSVPESFFVKYPHLRGARVDHPFHSYKPRYTMTLAHPAVRWHYAEMMNKIMHLFPDLDYAYIWSNDSGSGFEHTMTTYPGRNGGAFLVREWRTNEQIANKAGSNIFQYLTILKDTGKITNHDFRIILRIFSFPAAQDTLLKLFKDGYDIRILPSSISDTKKWEKFQQVEKQGSLLSTTVSLSIPYSHIVGAPFPWLCRKRLDELSAANIKRISLSVSPYSLAPYDINREIFKKFQFEPNIPVDSVISLVAKKWVGKMHSKTLIHAWKLTDETVEKFPYVPLYQGYGFVSFRLWARPLVPNIQNIPKEKRAYYEDFLLSNYYNPNLVDLSKNALWTLVPVDMAQNIVDKCEKQGYKPLNKAIELLNNEILHPELKDQSKKVLIDQRDRIRGLVCYYRTLENTARWIVGVHGYLDTNSENEKQKYKDFLHKMMTDEIENIQNLLALWHTSSVTFIPISKFGENWYTYGDNLGEILQKKIALMKEYMHDNPYIDTNFIWKMPNSFSIDPEKYLNHDFNIK